MAKIALIVFHKNADKIYPKEWIDEFKDSIRDQTYNDFTIHELNYGGDDVRIFTEEKKFSNGEIYDPYFHKSKYENHAEAMNHLIDLCFLAYDYDYVFLTNVDDIYSLDRIEKQLPYLEQGYDIVSSNFSLFNDEGIFHTHQFDKLDIKKELSKDHNVICHPVVAMSKNFWRSNRYYPHEIPTEDLQLWQRSINSFRFIILPEVLCYHREHSNSVGRSK